MIKIYANGAISRDGRYLGQRITQRDGGKFLTGTSHGDVDVGDIIHQLNAPAIVGALIDGTELPAGITMGARKDGTPRVVRA